MDCPMCNSKLKRGKVTEKYLGYNLGTYTGWVCTKCGENLLDEHSVEKAQKKAKELGIFGLSEKSTVAKSGNSLVVRIKKKVADYLGLKEGSEIMVHPEANRLVVEPMQ